MSESTTAASGLASQYAAQVVGDLERNEKEQERVCAEIAALQEQLATLEQDHVVLVNMQQALGVPSATAAVTVPAPRTKTASGPAGTGTRGKKTTAAPGTAKPKTKAGKPATAKATVTKAKSTATAAKPALPTLVDLVRGHLAEQGEPRSAMEVSTTLGQAHPDRSFKTTVVRNTLENLVAKGQAQRTKQGGSVFYTAPDATEQTPSEETPSDTTE